MRKIIFLLLITLAAIAFFIGCEADNPASIYDASKSGESTPVLSKMIPEDSTLAGIGEITIQGQNFSTVPENNLVYFDKTLVTVVSASESQITINSPNLLGDTIKVKIAVHGAYLYSNIMDYKLVPAVWEFGGFDEYNDPYAIACDSDENLYVSTKGKKVYKVTPDGERTIYSEDSGFSKASGMKMGPEGYLYYVNILSYMFRIPPGGGKYEMYTTLPGGAFDLDFGPNGNLFCGGNKNALYRVKPDKTSDVVADYTDIYIKSIRVYNDYVYVAGEYTGSDADAVQMGVWRNQILSDDGTVGEKELVLDWAALFTDHLLSINFSEDGDMYVGTDAPEGIIIFHEDGSYEGLYEGVIEPESYALCWGNGPFLYVTRRGSDGAQKRIMKVNAQKNGAPYYGRL